MKLETVDQSKLTLTDMMNNMSELYFLHYADELGKPVLTPMSLGSLSILENDSLLVRIRSDEDADTPVVVNEPKSERVYGNRHHTVLTYKHFGNDPTESIFVEFRPENSGIRVSFKDKESAELYLNYFREQFYTRTTGASVITVSNIYKDLNQVNFDEEECNDWGWYTLDNGTCRYISSYVTKNKNSKRYGFTLSKPTKLYESKKKA